MQLAGELRLSRPRGLCKVPFTSNSTAGGFSQAGERVKSETLVKRFCYYPTSHQACGLQGYGLFKEEKRTSPPQPYSTESRPSVGPLPPYTS